MHLLCERHAGRRLRSEPLAQHQRLHDDLHGHEHRHRDGDLRLRLLWHGGRGVPGRESCVQEALAGRQRVRHGDLRRGRLGWHAGGFRGLQHRQRHRLQAGRDATEPQPPPCCRTRAARSSHPLSAIAAQELRGLDTLLSLDSVFAWGIDPRGSWTRMRLNRWGSAERTWDAMGTIARSAYNPAGQVAWSEGKDGGVPAWPQCHQRVRPVVARSFRSGYRCGRTGAQTDPRTGGLRSHAGA
jgi:hypothetical protein